MISGVEPISFDVWRAYIWSSRTRLAAYVAVLAAVVVVGIVRFGTLIPYFIGFGMLAAHYAAVCFLVRGTPEGGVGDPSAESKAAPRWRLVSLPAWNRTLSDAGGKARWFTTCTLVFLAFAPVWMSPWGLLMLPAAFGVDYALTCGRLSRLPPPPVRPDLPPPPR